MEAILWFMVSCCLSVDAQYNRMSKEEPQFTYMNFLKKPGQVLAESFVSVSNVTDFWSCQLLCLDHTSCLSVNVGKKTNQTRLKCELNNSTSVLKPTKMRKRKGFDFYGLAHPCFSTPCLNGGTCIPNLSDGSYRCNCSLEISGVPNLNDHCAIDNSRVEKGTKMFSNVFLARARNLLSGSFSYNLNYYEAGRTCAMFGAQMSTLKQLEDARKVGYDSCSYGWVIDGTVRLPIYYQRPTSGCGGTGPPSIRGSTTVQDKQNARYNVYCYKETDSCGEMFDEDWHQNDVTCYRFYLDTKARWDQAVHACALEGAVLGVFDSQAKLDYVKDYVQRRHSVEEQILVGLRQGADSAWKWTGGVAVTSSLWNVTQPTGPIGTVNVANAATLNNVPDSDQWKLPFVCQKALP